MWSSWENRYQQLEPGSRVWPWPKLGCHLPGAKDRKQSGQLAEKEGACQEVEDRNSRGAQLTLPAASLALVLQHLLRLSAYLFLLPEVLSQGLQPLAVCPIKP